MTNKISVVRREYGHHSLSEKNVSGDPVKQFTLWMKKAIQAELFDPSAMLLATADSQGIPNTRIVLLKAIQEESFIFYTSYLSKKAEELEQNHFAAANFYWPKLIRQIRIRGSITKISAEQSAEYFSHRPRKSQISAIASEQSQVINSRKELIQKCNELIRQYKNQEVPCPKNWGGYALKPFEFEFWQGRDDRLHDRLHYRLENKKWIIERLAP